MKKDTSRIRQKLQHTEGARRSHVEKILQERGPLRRGSFVTVWRKCGKPNCRCAAGEKNRAGSAPRKRTDEFDYIEAASEVFKTEFFRYIQAKPILKALAKTYPNVELCGLQS